MKLLLFVSLSCPYCPRAESIAKKVVPEYHEQGIALEKLRIKTDEGRQLASRFSVMSLPTILLLDNDGNEIKRITGVPSEENLRNDIERCLGIKKSMFSKIFGR